MDELKKLYDVLVREGKYTKSFDEFQAKWSQDEEYKNKVYDVVSRDGLYTKDKNSFFQKYSVSAPEEAPVKEEIPQPSKKKFALDSSLEGGSSVSQPSPKKSTLPDKMPELTEEGFTQAVKKMKETPQDMSGKPLIKPLSEEQKSFLKKSAEEKKTEAVERKKIGEVFDKQLGVKPKVEESEYLNERLSSINTDLMNQTEENVVAEMQYQFGDLGFKFEPSGYLGDYMIVTSPDGKKTKEVSLDNFLNSKSSREANDLKKFIKENTPAKGLFVIENSLKEKDKKFNSEKEVEFETKKISTSLNELNARQKNVIQRRNALAKEYEALSKVPMSERNTQDFKDKVNLLEQKKLQIDEDVRSVLKDEENLKIKSSQLNRAVAKYTLTKQKQGGFFGALRDSFFRGVGSMSSGITNTVIDLFTELRPAGAGMATEDLKEISVDIAKKIGVKGPSANQTLEQWKSTLTEDQLDDWEDEVDDYIKKDFKSELLPAIRIGAEEIFGDPETTKQWSDLNKQGFWTGALLGLSQSLPAMIGGGGIAGWAQRTAQMYAQVTDNINEEMQNDSDFKNISENEKLAITLPIGITSAVLEAYGLRNVMASKGLINSITMSVLNKSGRNISAKTFRELVQDEVESRIARGLLIMGAAGLAEAETGAAQELTETSFKALYNKIKEKEMFRTPESTMDLLENVVVAGAQEAVGGFVLGLPSGVGVAYSKKGFLNMSDDAFNAFEEIANDDKIQSAYIASLKNKITSGELTTQEAKDELNNYRNSVGLYRQLPDGLTTQQKKEAMNLLKERKDLENYINGKDAALVVKQKNRIQEINDLLTNLTEEDAIQKQTTDESVLRTKQPEVELQGVGEGNAKLEGLTTEKEIADAKQKFIETSIERKGSELSKDELNYIDSIFDEKLKSLKKLEEVDALRDEESTATALGNLDIPWFDDFQSNFGENYKTVNDVSESYHKAKEDGSNPELVKAVESLLTPKATEKVTEQVTEEEVIPSTPISDALNDVSGVYVYDGKKGQLTTIGQTVVLETPTEIIDLGNVDELSDSTLADFGIQKEAELDITLNDDNSVVVGGKTYVNNYSTPDAAISQDKDGNYSVTLDTENGQKRTFRGQQADQIVYQMKLKNFEENGTEQQIDNAIELADEAIRVEEETREPSTEREGKTVRKGKRKQRTLKTVKEPLTKAEREAVTPAEPKSEVVTAEVAPAEVKAEATSVKFEQDIANEIYTKADNENSRLRKDVDTVSPKLEYDGDNESVKKEIERYDRLTRKVEEDGSFSNIYAYALILKLIRKGINTNNTRKLANALRKAGIFDGYSRLVQSGNNFTTLISDSSELIADTYFILSKSEKIEATKILTKLAKELGVDVANAETEANRPVEKIEANNKPAKTKETAPIKESTSKSSKTFDAKEIDKEISKNEDEFVIVQDEIEEIQRKIDLEEKKTKEEVKRLEEEIKKVKNDDSLSAAKEESKIKQLVAKIKDYQDKQEKVINSYKEDLGDANFKYKRILNKINNLYSQKRNTGANKTTQDLEKERFIEQTKVAARINKEIKDFNDRNRKYKGKTEEDSERYEEVRRIIFNEIVEKNKENYKYKEFFDKDPRLAAIERLKESKGNEEEIRNIKKDIEEYPIKPVEKPSKITDSDRKEIDGLIKEAEQEIERFIDSDVESIEYSKKFREEYRKDPRLAAILYLKEKFNTGLGIDMNAFNKSEEQIELLERDIKENPVVKKEPTEVEKEISNLENDLNELDVEIKQLNKELNSERGEMYSEVRDSNIKKFSTKINKLRNKKIEIYEKIKELYGEKITAPAVEPTESVNDLLDVDTKEKSGLKRVVDFLDKIDESLKLDPNELNDVTRVMAVGTAKVIVKTLRALVNAGITLQEAIKRTAEIHSIKADKIIDALDIMSKIVENKSEGISEMELPGYNALSSDIDSQIKDGKTVDEVISSVQKTDTYKNATDVQKELLVRNIRKRFGLREKSAPSVARLFGQLKDIKKITMTEKALLLQTMKDKAKASKDAVKAYKQVAQEIADGLKELKASGKITSNQATNILSQFAKVNMFSHKSVSKFVDYTTKILKDADYNSKIKTAKGLRSDIKQLSKNKEKNANLRDLAAEFAKIDPSMVEDIDAYNQKAAEVKRAVSGSKRRGANVKFAETVNIKDTYSYVNKTLEEQAEAIRKEKIAEIKELMNTDAEQFTDAEIDALLQPDANTDKYSEDIARAAIKKAFDLYSTLIKKSVKDGKTIFTEEDVNYTDSQKKVIEKFMAMDTDNMSTKDALNAVDSLINFLENQSTANMETVVQRYEGQQAIKQLKKKGIKAKALTKLGLKSFGRFLGDQTTNLNILFEKMFIGFNRASSVMKDMGLTELINKYAYAKNLSNKITTIYVANFYDKKANGQKFNTLFNNIERGMSAFMMRTVIGTEAEMEADFKKRKGLIEQSIDALSEGTKDEKKLADTYREVYDKILRDSKTIEDVTSKTDKVNLLAVEFWQERWSEKWDQMSDVATNVYNKNLKRELNYTPDRYSNLESNIESVNLENSDSAFIANTLGSLYKKEAASLMDVTGTDKLPVNNKSKKVKSYIDLSFDKNNSNSMYDALVDIETAAPIRKIQAFMDSAEFEDVFGEDADLIKGSKGSVGRVQQYVNNIRNKNPFSNDELSKTLKKLNKIASLGVAQALGGPTAIIKQTVPVMLSTMVNTNGSFDAKAAMDKDFMNWLKDAGYAISTRGVESQADIESINKLIEQAAESNYDKAMNLLEKANNLWLKTFLVNGDRWVAISSWKTYYEQSLKDRGLYKTTNITKTASGERIVETKGIDYSNHKVDETAADYAQKMVDRQQNISDSNMAGSLFSSKDTLKQVIVKTIMPFASFRMNQGSRIGADLRVLSNWKTADKEDREIAIRSLMGYGVETVTFRALQAGISILLYNITTSIMDRDDDEEERKKMKDRIYKGAATNIVGEVLSPMPIFDKLVQGGAAYVLESVQNGLEIPEEEKVALYKMGKEDFIKNLGTFGVTAGRAMELYELISMSVTGEYEDNYGKKRKISEENREALDDFIGPLVVSSLSGFSAPEMSSVARNAMRIAKKKYLTEEEKFIKQEKEIKEQEIKDIKLDALDRVIAKATNENVRREAENLYYELTVTDKEEIARIEENKKYEKEAIKDLLIDPVTGMEYSNVSDLKQYNKNLWVKNFGPNSEWYKENKFKKEVEKRLREELKKEKDKKYKR